MIFHYPLTSFISYTLSAETGPDHSKCSTTKLSGQVNNSNEPLTFEICDLLIYGYMESGRILGELTLKIKGKVREQVEPTGENSPENSENLNLVFSHL